MGHGQQKTERFSIDAESVAAYRAELQKMAHGQPLAEAALEGFSDWQVIEAMERLWAAGTELQPRELDASREAVE
ncbi:MAG: hypothetical protein WBM00_08265 [Solirubrobacterales bacterium]